MSWLYILEINSFICNIIFQFWCLSPFCLWFPLLAKTFKFKYVPFVCLFVCLFVCFYFHYSRWWIKKISLGFMSESVLLIFSSKSLIVFGVTFRSLIHFEFKIVYSVREFSNFIPLNVAIQFSQHHLLRRLSFFHCIFLLPLW